jgi:hypothetical protein
MAKSDLLKQAIADANAVKETALANAKIALQEAFAPRIQSMISTRLREELEDEEMPEDEFAANDEMGDDAAMADDEMGGNPETVGVGLDFDMDGEYDLTGDLGAVEDEEMPADDEFSDEEANDEYAEEESDDLELESILRELEEDLEHDDDIDPEHREQDGSDIDAEMYRRDEGEEYGVDDESDINEIIEAILREEDDAEGDVSHDELEEAKEELEDKKAELEEAYKTVKKLTSIINEVNLLNAKLLYTNKLFRNFDLNESQKMKVIENFDRAGNTREVKLVFSTLAESFNRPQSKKKMVKESYASKPVRTTAPAKPILNEGFELADRWKKLAGLL